MAESAVKSTISFERFTVDPIKRTVSENGNSIKLNPKTFDLLVALIGKSGEVISKDELLEIVWEGQFVEENNLTVNISLLRKALGEKKKNKSFIITVPGKGYKFIAEIEINNEVVKSQQISDESSAEESPITLHTPPKKSSSKNLYLFAGIAAIILIAGVAALFFTDFGQQILGTKNAPIPQSQQNLISNFPGSHSQASFSPDGNRIAFVNETEESSSIWVKDLSSGEPFQLSSEKMPARRPRWSPVGDEIIYVAGRGKTDIYSISLNDREPRKIIDGGRNPNWSWDGNKIVFERDYDIWTANKDGSDQLRVKGVPPTDLLLAGRMPAFSPDGSQIVYFQNDKGPMGDYFIIPAEGGEVRRLTSDRTFGDAPVWTPNGKSIIFPSRRGGSMTLWKISNDGGEPEPVLNSSGEDTQPHISPDGRKLIYTNTRKTYTLMKTDTESSKEVELKESRLHLVHPSFSPDGSRIMYFGMNGDGDVHIFTTDKNGKGMTQVTSGEKQENIHPQWSSDGQTIYYYQAYPTNSFRKISATGGESTEMVKGWEWGTHNHAQVSPDGKKIIYTKLDRGKAVATMIRDVASGKEKAFDLILRQAHWSHDGKSIVGIDLSKGGWTNPEIMICTAEGNPCRKIAIGALPEWSDDDSKIYFQTSGNSDGKTIRVVSREGGEPSKMANLSPMEFIGPFYAVSSQREVIWIKYEQSKSELWLADFASQ